MVFSMARKLQSKIPSSERTADAKRLLKLRKKMNWSQKQLAEAFGVNSTTVSWWENGERNMSRMALKLLEIYKSNEKDGI